MNYTELQAAIADTLNRDDLAAQIPVFIRLAEAQLDREIVARQDFRYQELDQVSGSIPLPCDFAGVLAITAFGQPNKKIVYMAPDMLDEQWLSSNGAPHYYTISATQIIFSPSVEFDGLLRYWRHIQTLSNTCRENWILSSHPDVYLYGALVHAAPYLKDDDRIPVWNGFYESAIRSINQQSVEQQFGAHVEIQNRGVV